MKKKAINIVWFKRDLRLTDHEPLYYALQSELPLLLIYIFEPSVMAYHDSDVRHWRFVFESLKEMNERLKTTNTQIYIFHNEAKEVFEMLAYQFNIHSIFSSEEIGNGLTYERDKAMKILFSNNHILWNEYQTNGIVRGLKTRQNWEKLWENQMTKQPNLVKENGWNMVELDQSIFNKIKGEELNIEITTRNKNFQEGGEYWAWRYLENFLKHPLQLSY